MLNTIALRTIPYSKGKVALATWPEFFLVLSVFTKEIGSRRIFGIDFDWIGYTFAIFYLVFNFYRVFSSKNIRWAFFGYVLISSLLSIVLLDMAYGNFFKLIIPVLIIFSANFYIIGNADHRVIFKLYVKLTYYTAIFGLIQFVLSHSNIYILGGGHRRIDSIAYEPSHYCAILVPAVVFTLFNLKEYKKEFIVLFTTLIFTYNITGYLALLSVVSIVYISPIYILFSLPILYFLVFHVLVNFNENFNIRINDTLAVFKGEIGILGSQVEANGTTVSFYSNLMVGLNNLKNYALIGTGLGGHEESYYRYYENSYFRYNWHYGLNAASGHSLTIRIFSEFGIVGLLLYVFSIIRRIVFLDNGYFRSISLACLSHFICKTFKLGGYIDYGTPFFVAMLMINYTVYSQSREA